MGNLMFVFSLSLVQEDRGNQETGGSRLSFEHSNSLSTSRNLRVEDHVTNAALGNMRMLVGIAPGPKPRRCLQQVLKMSRSLAFGSCISGQHRLRLGEAVLV